jgi:hypothetical protein
MSKGFKIKKEEYTTVADFIRPSFVRDQGAIVARYPRFDGVFLAAFDGQLAVVKTLESGLVVTMAQKNATVSLAAEADVLNKELNFLNSYIRDAGLTTGAVTDLKKDLNNGNIEGAVMKLESVKQFVVANTTALEAEGMAVGFAGVLDAHKVSMADKNRLQNDYMVAHKRLVDANKGQFEALYGFISKIAEKGKLVFANTVTKDEYTISKTIAARVVAP